MSEDRKQAVMGTCMKKSHSNAPAHPMDTSCFNWKPLAAEKAAAPEPWFIDAPGAAQNKSQPSPAVKIAKYPDQKHCCTICAQRRRCSVCDEQTTSACSDCAIDLRATVYVCGKNVCREQHENKCPHELQAKLSLYRASELERLERLRQGCEESVRECMYCTGPAEQTSQTCFHHRHL